VAKMLCKLDCGTDQPVFQIKDKTKHKPILTLSDEAGDTVESRTKAVAIVMEKLRDDGFVTGWRDELYKVSETFFYDEPTLLIERAAANVLGIMDYGVHINGLVQENNPNDKPKMWIARRSATKSKFPEMLDHIVAGGQPYGLSLMDNVVKECEEEADSPMDVTWAGVHPAGAISYET
jgi:hypothetical protein